MAVVFNRLTQNPITLQALLQQLDANLLAAGWSREYVDPDALTGGSGGAPGWGKTPAANTTAGFAVYRMPAVGSLNRWYVRIEGRWGANSTAQNFFVRLTGATGVDSGTGALSGAGTVLGVDATASSQNNNSGDNYVIAFEHGFLLGINQSSLGYFLGLERRRTLAGAYTSDLAIYAITGGTSSSINPVGFASFNSTSRAGAAQVMVRGSLGELGVQPLVSLQSHLVNGTSGSVAQPPATFNTAGNAQGYPAGLFVTSGGLSGMLRLIQTWLPNDCSPLSAQTVNIDGADRNYFAVGSGITPNGYRLLVAMS